MSADSAAKEQQAPQPEHDGLMRLNKPGNAEGIKISHFILEPTGVAINEILLEVDFKTSTFAVAAMLKGLHEYYFKPAGQAGHGEAMAQSEHNLKVWEQACQKAQSRIIMP